MDVLPNVLQLLVLVLLHLDAHVDTSANSSQTHGIHTGNTNLQPFLQETVPPLQTVGVLVGVAPVSDQEHEGLQREQKQRPGATRTTLTTAEQNGAAETGPHLKGFLIDLLQGQASVLGEELRRETGVRGGSEDTSADNTPTATPRSGGLMGHRVHQEGPTTADSHMMSA